MKHFLPCLIILFLSGCQRNIDPNSNPLIIPQHALKAPADNNFTQTK